MASADTADSCRVSTSVVAVNHTVDTFVGQGDHSPGKVGGKKSVKICSCMWSATASIVLDTKYARKELFRR